MSNMKGFTKNFGVTGITTPVEINARVGHTWTGGVRATNPTVELSMHQPETRKFYNIAMTPAEALHLARQLTINAEEVMRRCTPPRHDF